jgi:hypothetical protein
MLLFGWIASQLRSLVNRVIIDRNLYRKIKQIMLLGTRLVNQSLLSTSNSRYIRESL